ncbi:MAG: hypothetical protein LBL98_04500 [Ruminococcus sp.]|jgi:uncharacterized phage-associated protein|nr:hypothetical protein [Ruminococcus sp.]
MLSDRRKALLNWLTETCKQGSNYLTDIPMQKFLFFYECFSKIDGDFYDFSNLMGYKRGPVFSDVYEAKKYYQIYIIDDKKAEYQINQNRARLAFFLVQVLGNDLSDFTHTLDIWKSKEEQIKNGAVKLSEEDFSEADTEKFIEIKNAFTPEFIDSFNIVDINGTAFLFPKNAEFKDEYYDAFYIASHDEKFQSPVYADVIGGELYLD